MTQSLQSAESPVVDTFLPNLCSPLSLFLVVLFSELLAIILALSSAQLENIILELAILSLIVQWISLVSATVLCLYRKINRFSSAMLQGLVACGLILLVALIVTELVWLFTYFMSNQTEYWSKAHFWWTIQSMGITMLIAAAALRYLYVNHQWRKNIEISTQASFQSLQARIRPHFLFNCMNTIATLTREDPTRAERVVEDLADLLRSSLTDSLSLKPFREEVKLCKQYIGIEGQRLGERLQVVWEIDSIPEDALIPALGLQPLLENAIYHGIESISRGGTITICGIREEKRLSIQLTNPLPQSHQVRKSTGHQLAQTNIRQRFESIYGKDGQLIISKTPHQYSVVLNFLYKTHEEL